MEDASKITNILIEAIERTGVRAIISRGWSKLGGGRQSSNILFIDDCPHGMGPHQAFVWG